jgi:PBP1b-binding outer membrane lipoprotein LpoB
LKEITVNLINRIASAGRFLIVAIAVVVSGCAVQLAPPYDKVVADGLVLVSTEAMTLIATVSPGSKSDTFSVRAEKYDGLIGKVEALAIQAGARPMPKNNVTDAINRSLDKRASQTLPDDNFTPPSAHAIKKVAETLTKMRDTDRKQGITASEAQLFKGQTVIYLDQATTYENFLQR